MRAQSKVVRLASLRSGADALHQPTVGPLSRGLCLFYMTSLEQSNLVGLQDNPGDYTPGGGDKLLEGGNTLGDLARELVIVLPKDVVSDSDRICLAGTT